MNMFNVRCGLFSSSPTHTLKVSPAGAPPHVKHVRGEPADMKRTLGGGVHGGQPASARASDADTDTAEQI